VLGVAAGACGPSLFFVLLAERAADGQVKYMVKV
jgi:hypothetical protein